MKELKNYSPKALSQDAHVGQVKSYSTPAVPAAPAVPSAAELAQELAHYDSALVSTPRFPESFSLTLGTIASPPRLLPSPLPPSRRAPPKEPTNSSLKFRPTSSTKPLTKRAYYHLEYTEYPTASFQ